VVALRVLGEGLELALDPTRGTLTIGSAAAPTVDLHLPGNAVSRRHARIHVEGNRIIIVDAASTNGITLHDQRESRFEVVSGQTLGIADKKILAMDESLRSLRPALEWCLGFDAHLVVDKALSEIAQVSQPPILLTGRSGCDQKQLAEAIHRASARRHRIFAAVPPLADRSDEKRFLVYASGGTAYLDLKTVSRVTAFFANELFGTTYHVRPVVVAQDRGRAEFLLGEHSHRLCEVAVTPLANRTRDVPRLLNEILAADLASEKRVEELGEENVQALIEYGWRGNIDGLRRVAPKLDAVLKAGGLVAAAKLLGISHQALSETLSAIGLRFRR